MADLKTKPTGQDVEAFLASVDDEARRQDCRSLAALMADVTREPPPLWGSSMVGFGSYRYRYGSEREGEYFVVGFSPRKAAETRYLMGGLEGRDVLRELAADSVRRMSEQYG